MTPEERARAYFAAIGFRCADAYMLQAAITQLTQEFMEAEAAGELRSELRGVLHGVQQGKRAAYEEMARMCGREADKQARGCCFHALMWVVGRARELAGEGGGHG